MSIDIQKLKQDRRELEVRIRVIKKELRTTWTQPMANAQYELISLKRQATELCILRAWVRGRHHLPNIDYCKEVAERLIERYKVEEVEVESTYSSQRGSEVTDAQTDYR